MPKNIRNIKMSFLHEKELKRLFQKLTFYNVLIEKLRIEYLNTVWTSILRRFSSCKNIESI